MCKLTENEVIIFLIEYLEKKGWTIQGHCLGNSKGADIKASKGKSTLIIEAKGAKADKNSPSRIRAKFDSGQIKTHFGVAIVTLLVEKYKNPDHLLAIAQPDDNEIRKAVGHLVPLLKPLGIKHYWVSETGTVKEE